MSGTVLGQVVGVVAGIIVGYVTDNPQAGIATYTVIAGVATALATKGKAVNGPQLSDLSIQLSAEGTPIPWIFGRMRVAGNVVWGTQKIPHSHSSGGGKGSSTPVQNTTSYTQSVAIKFCRGEMAGYGRAWFDKKLMIDFSHTADAATIIASDFLAKSVRFYPGTDTQMPDSLIVSYEGAGNVSARRGDCYLVFEELQIDQFGERIPQIEVELLGNASQTVTRLNICSLTPADQGFTSFRGRSWVGDREIWYWRQLYLSDPTKLAMYHSSDGQEGVYAGVFTLQYANAGEIRPCQTQDRPAMCCLNYEEDPYDHTHILQSIYISYLAPVPNQTDDGIRVIRLEALSTYTNFNDQYNMVATDQDTDVVAIAIRSDNSVYYGQRISVYGAGRSIVEANRPANGEYVFRDPATHPNGPPTCEALACALGRVYALISYPDGMHLVVLDQADASLIADYPGPNVSLGFGASEVMCSMCTDGVTTWCSTMSGTGYVWKWLSDGSYVVLSTGAVPVNDSGRDDSFLGGPACFINDDHVISQLPTTATDNVQPVFRHQLVRYTASSGVDVPLSTIVSAICASRGVACDAHELTDIMVSGFVISRQMTAVDALNYLAAVYFFDGVPSSTGVYFKLRGGPAVMTINTADLAAHDFGATPPEALSEDRAKEIDVPQYFAVNFTNIDNDYQPGSVPALRLNTTTQQVVTLDATAIAMTATQAAQLAEVAKVTSWVERTTNTFSGDYRLKALQVADVVMIDDGSVLRRRRIRSVKDQQGLLEFDCVADDAAAYTSTRVVSGARSGSTVRIPVSPDLQLLDVAPLQDSDVGPALYAKVTPRLPVATGTAWSGAQLIRTDDGSNAVIGLAAGRSIIGVTTTALAAYSGINAFDESGRFQALLRGGGSPASLTRELVLAGRTAWLVGEEVLIARDVVQVSGDLYEFSGLLRYRRGTERAAVHVVGDRVVLLERACMLEANNDDARPHVYRQFTAVSFGRTIDTGSSASILSEDVFRTCFAPVNVRAAIGADYISFTWNRRTRLTNPDPFSPGLRADEQDAYSIKTERRATGAVGELAFYDNEQRYFNQLLGEPTDFHFQVAQMLRDGTVGEYSDPLLVHGGVAPNPKTTLFVSTTAANGATTFVNSGGAGINVAAVGGAHATSNRAVFAGGTDALLCGPSLPEELFGFGIRVFEIRLKFKTTSTGVLMSHTTPAFDQGSWRLQIEDVGPFHGLLQFCFSDFASSGAPLLQSADAAGNFRDGVEHDLRVYQASATGDVWLMQVDGVGVAVNGWRNRVGGNFPGVGISIGNDPNRPGHGFVGSIGDPCINIFTGLY